MLAATVTLAASKQPGVGLQPRSFESAAGRALTITTVPAAKNFNYLGRLTYGDYVLLQTLRLISLPFLHAIWTAIAGYYVGLPTAAALHGFLDFLDAWLSSGVYAASILRFASYARSTDEIGETLASENMTTSLPT